MKDFLKSKPKDDFQKPPAMPEDMKELFRQRQRELAAERAQFAEDASKTAGDQTNVPAADTQPKLEQVTLPPPPKTDETPTTAPAKTEPVTPKTEAPPPPPTRPREVEPQKKKGKKGDGEP
jgi:hypothetical protein